MLQAIRSRASGIVVQVLFGLLILTFALWGIGDIFRDRATDTTVATVGDLKIDAAEVSTALKQQIDRMRRATNASLTQEQIKELGLIDTTIQQVIDQHLLDLEARRLGLAVNDEAVRQAIVTNPTFRGAGGGFDRNVYLQLLGANQMSDQQYESLLRTDMVRNRIVHAVTSGATAPPALIDALWHSRGERRVATALLIPPKSIGDLGKPDEAALQKFYDDHKVDFELPERRSFTVAVLDPDQVVAGIKIPDDKIADAYKSRSEEFREPEKREVQQILVPDEAKAKEIKAALDGGKDFAAAAKETGEADDTLNLGAVTLNDLPGELGKTAFAMKSGEVSAPIHDPFGWHIVKVGTITPEQVLPYEKAKDKLALELAREQAGDDIAKTANAIDDALAGGAKFSEVVAKFSLKPVTVTDANEAGHDPQDKPIEIAGAPVEDVLKTAFGTPAGGVSDLRDTPAQGFYLLTVDKVTPAAAQPLSVVRDKVVAAWETEERQTRLAKLADSIAASVSAGQSLDDAAGLRGLKTFDAKPFSRFGGGDSEIPPSLAPKLFAAKLGQAVAGLADPERGYMVAVVKEILPPDPAQETAQKAQISRQIDQEMAADVLTQYERALRQRFPVTVDQAALDRLL